MLSVPICDTVGFSESTNCCTGLWCVCVWELKAWLSAHVIHTQEKFTSEKWILQSIYKLTH